MAARVCVRNMFLCLDSSDDVQSRRARAHTEGSLRLGAICEFTRQDDMVQKLQAVLCEAERARALKDCGRCLGRSLGKVGAVLSSSSVSTMAPSEESDEESLGCGETALSWADCEESPQGVAGRAPRESKSSLVPKRVNLVEGYAKSRRAGQAVTTVMLRNIPNRCSQRELIAELEAAGFQGCFDFLYIPLDLGTMCNVGYAFVNFTHSAHALRCMEELPRHPFKRQRRAGKAVAVLPAHMQGLEANLRHYEKAAVNTSRLRQRRPVVMDVFNAASSASFA